MQNEFNQFLQQNYDNVGDQINSLAESHNLTVNVIPDGVGNIDIEDNRVNIWVEQSSGKIYKITMG